MQRRFSKLGFGACAGAGLLALGAAGCGGETLPPPDGGEQVSYDPCEDSANLETVLVADFEGDFVVNPFSSNDGTSTMIFGPQPAALSEPKCPGGDAGSAFHVTAQGLQDYGLSFGFNNLGVLPGAGGAAYFDAEAWDGFSLWVRRGHAKASGSIFAALSERYTDPAGALLFTAEEQDGLLEASQCPADQAMGQRCYCAFDPVDIADPMSSQCDRFGAGIGIDVEWRFFKVPFEKLRQRAYGRPSPLPSPDRRILGFDFGLQGADIDFWMDDLAFYRDPPPDAASE